MRRLVAVAVSSLAILHSAALTYAQDNMSSALDIITQCESAMQAGEEIEAFATQLRDLEGVDFQSHPRQQGIALACLRSHFGSFYYYDQDTLSFISREERALRLQEAEEERAEIEERDRLVQEIEAAEQREFFRQYRMLLSDACYEALEDEPLVALTEPLCVEIFESEGFGR